MSKALKVLIVTVSLGIILFAVAGGLGVKASTNDGAYRQLGVYSEVLSRIRSEYVEEPNIQTVTDGSLHGLLESLDANSSYLSPAEYKVYKQRKADGKGEIGATISKRFGYAAVISVVPGGPADKAGIENADIIEAIEGKSTHEMSLAEVNAMLTGQPGSNVTFSIVRARRAEPQKVTVTRDLITLPPVSERMLEDGVGYVRPYALTKGRAQEIAADIKALQKQGARKLILDLRDCSVGEASEGVAAANLFLNHGMISYLQGQKFAKETFNADPQKDVTDVPLVVMVNRGTAGPSEIVAAAVMENARGDVVGDKTFGTGGVQKVIEIPDGSALILTVAKYYTPGGKAIQDTAITPNILVADADESDVVLPDEDQDNGAEQEFRKEERQKQDEQLRRSIQVLKNKELKAAAAPQ
ncbi:MAG TPA: S41 family peptidase [Terriglobales bacterium]|nr:S41 family peptidase [Terriglobales bacterium]